MTILKISCEIIEPVIRELSGNKYQWENQNSFILFDVFFFRPIWGYYRAKVIIGKEKVDFFFICPISDLLKDKEELANRINKANSSSIIRFGYTQGEDYEEVKNNMPCIRARVTIAIEKIFSQIIFSNWLTLVLNTIDKHTTSFREHGKSPWEQALEMLEKMENRNKKRKDI